MTEKEIICVICPSSCHITVKGDGSKVEEVTGYTCKRGMEYATNEFISPVRTLTTTVKAKDYTCPVIAVRSNKPMPKDKIFEAMEEIRNVTAEPPYYVGKTIIKDILGCGVDIVLANQ